MTEKQIKMKNIADLTCPPSKKFLYEKEINKSEETKMIEKKMDLICETLTFKKIGKLFNYRGKEIEFFKSQVLVKELRDFHITVAPEITDDQKREAVIEMIDIWDDKSRIECLITDL